MSSEGRDSQPAPEQALDGVVREAEAYYGHLKRKFIRETVTDFILGSVFVWFASFFVGRFVLPAVYRVPSLEFEVLIAFIATAIIRSGDYLRARRKGFRFARLGATLDRMKQEMVSSEDGLRLIDELHDAALLVESRRLELALEYAVVSLIAILLVANSVVYGAIAGIAVFVVFAARASEERRKKVEKYENSKKELLQSL